MPASSPTPAEKARKSEVVFLRALQEPGKQTAVAAAMAVSDSTISRLKSDHLSTFCLVLAHLGLRIVPADQQCFPPRLVDAWITIAKHRMDQIETSVDLEAGQ